MDEGLHPSDTPRLSRAFSNKDLAALPSKWTDEGLPRQFIASNMARDASGLKFVVEL